MEFLKKKPIAMLAMSLIILASLVLTAKTSIGEAVIILLSLLAIFIVIDFIAEAKFLSEKQTGFASIVVGLIAVVGIGIWGTIAVPGVPVNNGENVEQGSILSPTATDEIYELGLFYFERGDYEEAIQALKSVTSDSSSYVDAQELLAKATDCYRDKLMDTANTYVEKDDYKLAIDILNAGLLVIPDDAKLLQTIDDCSTKYTDSVRTSAIAEAETYATGQDYANALVTVQSAVAEVGGDAELNALVDKYLSAYRESVLTQANEILYNNGYDAANSFLKESIYIVPNDPVITKKIEEFKALAPITLDQLSMLTGDDWYIYDSVDDNLGNTHTHALGSSFYDDETKVYKLGAMYTRIQGTLFIRSDTKNSAKWGTTFKISGDGKLLYSAELWDGDEPISFNVDISGVDKLEIYYYWGAAASYTSGFACIGECYLYRY